MTIDKLLRPCDAIKALNVSKSKFYRMIEANEIKPVYVGQGRGRRIKMSSLPCVQSN
jgi:excisionase family DNA binding protein